MHNKWTGANLTFAGEKSEEAENCFFTAYEAINLNLDNMDLVLLSACETGLVEFKNGEGELGSKAVGAARQTALGVQKAVWPKAPTAGMPKSRF